MNDKDWGRFFDLVEKVVSMPGLSANEKADLTAEKAREFGAESWYEELLAYHACDTSDA